MKAMESKCSSCPDRVKCYQLFKDSEKGLEDKIVYNPSVVFPGICKTCG